MKSPCFRLLQGADVTFLTTAPIELQLLIDAVTAPERGAVASFLGVVRDHHDGRGVLALTYSCYHPMAEAVSRDILSEAEIRWPVKVALLHRVGELAIGDVAVAVAVAGSHRDEAFLACRYVIEELKGRVPIWKRETYSDGTVHWVDPTSPGAELREAEVADR